MDVAQFRALYPRVYHMAEVGSWNSIKAHGLLSASAVLDLVGKMGEARRMLEEQHRPAKVTVSGNGATFVLRDQIPMAPRRLSMGLEDGLTPRDWYLLLNHKVFFWVSPERLKRLMGARHYVDLEHDVLTIDTGALLAAHAEQAWLCHMNSGNTFPVPHKRGARTFRRISDYPVRKNGRPEKEVVELVVDYSVPDVASYVIEAWRMKNGRKLAKIV